MSQRPDYRLTVDGTDITPTVNARLVRLSLSESRGESADTLTLTLSDHDGALAIPPHGAAITLALGWQGSLVDKGRFTVSETEHTGAPDALTIRAHSANLRDALPGKKSRSWSRVTLGELVEQIASEHSLAPVIDPELANTELPAPQQTAESDLHLLTRLAEPHDAMVAVKEGRLLFLPKGRATTVSGAPLPPVAITRGDGDQHRYTFVERDAYTGVRAKWNDLEQAEYQWVVAGSDDEATELPDTYSSEQDAITAAKAEWARLQRGLATISLTLASGNPDLKPETPVQCSGWKADIDGKEWVATQVVHNLDDSGLMTMLEAEVRKGA